LFALRVVSFKLTTTQISASSDATLGELELDEDVPSHISDEQFTEEGLAFLIALKRSWRCHTPNVFGTVDMEKVSR